MWTEEERARIVEVANETRFAEIPSARIVPVLADEGVYIASGSSFHRLLRALGQMNRRGRARPPRRSRPPTTHSQPGPLLRERRLLCPVRSPVIRWDCPEIGGIRPPSPIAGMLGRTD
jgi:hypothetical protein